MQQGHAETVNGNRRRFPARPDLPGGPKQRRFRLRFCCHVAATNCESIEEETGRAETSAVRKSWSSLQDRESFVVSDLRAQCSIPLISTT